MSRNRKSVMQAASISQAAKKGNNILDSVLRIGNGLRLLQVVLASGK